MRYWWVNQNQTYRQEVEGGYLWSPKRNANGATNPFYESMREVAPGDLIFSFADTRIQAIGVAQSYCWENPKPAEFGIAGQNWENIGWKVRVGFTELVHKLRPKDHIDILRPLLPRRYSPLQPTGNGLQSVYLTEVPSAMAEVLMGLIGQEAGHIASMAQAVLPRAADDLDDWERRLERQVANDPSVPETDRTAIIKARKGQGLFKDRVSKIETRCRITGVQNPVHLVASHCKPWRDSSNDERLNGENGLLLTPSIDHLFDRGFIGFEDNGRVIISPVAHRPSLQRMGVDTEGVINVGGFTSGQKTFLQFHRNAVLLQAVRRYSPEHGARFEVHFEKLRNRVDGDGAVPFEARLETALTDAGERGRWSAHTLQAPLFKQAAKLYGQGLSVRQVAASLRISKSEAGRLRLKASDAGLIVDGEEAASTVTNGHGPILLQG